MATRYQQPPQLDSQIGIDGDNGFLGLDSHTDPTLLKPGHLQTAENVRLDESTGIARGRKGMKRVSANSNLLAEADVMASARFQHPDGTDYVCLAADNKAYFVDASNTGSVQTTEVAYQTRGGVVETAGTDSELVQAYDKLYLFRGKGLRLPTGPLSGSPTLGNYPLVFDGDVATPGTFNRPGTVAITGATNTDPIVITAANHGFSTDDLVTITNVEGNTNANGTYYIKVLTTNTFELIGRAGNSGFSTGAGLAVVVTESSELPAADFAVYYRNRMCVPSNFDEVHYSDVLSDYSFAATNQFKFNVGTSDSIVSMLPVMDDGMLVLKRHSIMLQTGIGNLGNTAITEVTRQMGCVSRKSAISVGGAVFFLSDSGVYAIDFGIRGQDRVGTPVTALRISDNPISRPIHDVIETIDWSVAVKESSATFFNNRYWLAVPIQGTGTARASKILVYNVNLKSWESVDSHGTEVYFDELLVGTYGKSQRLYAVTTSGKLLVLDENATGADESGNGGSVTSTDLTWKARTRGYTLRDFGEKRWLYGSAGIAVNDATSARSMVVGVSTQDPDGSAASHATFAFAAAEDALARFSLKKRAYALDLTFSCAGGQPELRRAQVEGIQSDRIITTFE